jgi:flavin-dependent dehydrogenase
MNDVFVAGGGPAGLAAAIAARRAGFDVTVFDAARPPIDKACGEGIMPDGIDALSRLGITIPRELAIPFRGIRFIDGAHEVAAPFPHGVGLGLRRTALHEILIDTAKGLGVSMRWGTRGDAGELTARWIIVATGLPDARAADRRFGSRQHYRIVPWSDHVEVHWSDCGQLYITPTAADEVCVVFVTRRERLRLPDALEMFPEARRRLAGARALETVRGAVTTTRTPRAVHRGNIAFVGDASGSIDAVTGEGLAVAFRQASALADALRAGDLARYQRAHDAIMRRPRAMSRLMLLMDRHPFIRRGAFRVLAGLPQLFEQLLAFHVGAPEPS